MEHPIRISCRGRATNGSTAQYKYAALAAAMIAPIRRTLDYQGLARRVLMIEPLVPGVK